MNPKQSNEIYSVKVKKLRPGLYGCRVSSLETGKVIVEVRVPKTQIGDGIYSMLRTLDKCGPYSPMAHATRQRQKGRDIPVKFHWYPK